VTEPDEWFEEPQDEVLQDEVLPDDEDVLVLEEVDYELLLPMWEPTGEPRVDEALELLSTLDVDDVHSHTEVYGQIHVQLRAALTDVDPAG
jgi:hypothetical protein